MLLRPKQALVPLPRNEEIKRLQVPGKKTKNLAQKMYEKENNIKLLLNADLVMLLFSFYVHRCYKHISKNKTTNNIFLAIVLYKRKTLLDILYHILLEILHQAKVI